MSSVLKHLGIVIDKKLTFGNHLKENISNANKRIGLITRLYLFAKKNTNKYL